MVETLLVTGFPYSEVVHDDRKVIGMFGAPAGNGGFFFS